MKNLHILLVGFALLPTCTARAALVTHFRLEEGALDPLTNATYSADGGYTGTMQGGLYYPAWTTTDLGPVPSSEGGTTAAISFDATDASTDPYISTDAPGVLGTGARTFAAWIKASANQPNFATFLAYGNNGTGQAIRFRLDPSGFLRLEYSGSAALGNSRRLNDGQWHHVAATLPTSPKAGDTIFYIDGNVEPTTVSNPNNLINTTAGNMSPFTIGNSRHSLATYGFNGVVDDVRIYDEQLSQAQIQQLVFGAGTPPTIDRQPVAKKAILGGTNETVSFSVDVSGSPPLTYQWKKDNVNLPGATAQNLVISPVTVADLGSYSVAITNAYGFAISSAAGLSWGTPAVDPTEQTVVVGGTAQFTVTMPADSSGYTYQWKKAGVVIAQATASAYAIAGAVTGDSAAYSVEVSLAGQSATSDPAQLRVVTAPASPYARLVLEDGPSAYWRLNETSVPGTAQDVTTFHPGTYFGAASPSQPGAITGDTDPAVDFFVGGNGYIEVPHSAALNRTNAFTVEGWAKPSGSTGRQSIVASRTSTRSSGYELLANGTQWQFRTGASSDATVEVWSNLNGGTVVPGAWHHVVGTYDGTTKSLYVNGQLVGTQTAPVFATLGTPLRVGADQTYNATPGDYFLGTLDEVAVYWRALTPAQVADHYAAGILGQGVPPTLATPPQSARLLLGDTNATVTFNVVASGSPRLKYQWKKGGADLPGGTAATLTFSPASAADLGTYSVVVTNEAGTVSSPNVTLTYGLGPVAPAGLAVLAGGQATFTLIGMPAYQTYTYQWKHAGTNLPGATAASLTLSAVTTAEAGDYTVVATLGSDSAESDPVLLAVLAPPTQPYATVVSGHNPVAYWRLNEPAGSFAATDTVGNRSASSSFGDQDGDIAWAREGALLGDANASVRFTGYSAGGRAGRAKLEAPFDAALNPAVFSIECWAMLSGKTTGYRSPVTSRDGTTGVCKGYIFYVSPAGNWEFWLGDGISWSAVRGGAAPMNEWTHLVGAYDGTTMSFYINGILAGILATAFVPNDTYPFRIGAGASENTTGTFFWPGRVDEVAVYGSALSLAQVQSHYAAAFQPGAAPRITQQPLTRATVAGADCTLRVRAHGASPVTYQWQHSGTNLPGATAATLSLTAVSDADAGSYQAVVTRGGLSVTSAAAVLTVLPGQAVSASIQGFNARTIAGEGGVAGYVAVPNWNEIAYNANNGSTTNLSNHAGQVQPITVTWTANNNRQWNGPFATPAADYALLGGFIEDGGVTNVIVTVSNLPAEYQSAGYAVYVYMGAPHAGSGLVSFGDWFGAVSIGSVTNYFHGIDLALWDGDYARAVTTDPNNSAPADANYAVFSGLSSSSFVIRTAQHPLGFPGPAAISGFQIVANVPPTVPAVPLAIGWVGSNLVLTWTGNWVLQSQAVLDGQPGGWTDVAGATTGYVIPTPLATAQFYRLRSP